MPSAGSYLVYVDAVVDDPAIDTGAPMNGYCFLSWPDANYTTSGEFAITGTANDFGANVFSQVLTVPEAESLDVACENDADQPIPVVNTDWYVSPVSASAS